jgi:integrase
LPSGRWQARFPGADGRLRPAPATFERKRDAERYLTMVEAAIVRGQWIDPARSMVTLQDYAARWIDQRPGLRPRTLQLYRWTLSKHIAPYLGGVALGQLDAPMIREWRARLLADDVSAGMAAKAYRLLRAVLMTAVNEDEILPRNPCRIPGADKESPDERPTLTVTEVRQLAGAVPERYRMMVLSAAMASLRFGEITALQRRDVDLESATIRVREQFVEVKGHGLVASPPKSRAGIRVISIPSGLVSLLAQHLDAYVGAEASSLVFTTSTGAPIRRGSFNKLVGWMDAVSSIGHEGLHFHDLRHTGNLLAAGSRVSTRDLMARMGHDSMTAALIYQHATREADGVIAAHLDARMQAALPADRSSGDGDMPSGGAPRRFA